MAQQITDHFDLLLQEVLSSFSDHTTFFLLLSTLKCCDGALTLALQMTMWVILVSTRKANFNLTSLFIPTETVLTCSCFPPTSLHHPKACFHSCSLVISHSLTLQAFVHLQAHTYRVISAQPSGSVMLKLLFSVFRQTKQRVFQWKAPTALGNSTDALCVCVCVFL